jgi:hypothetical protein
VTIRRRTLPPLRQLRVPRRRHAIPLARLLNDRPQDAPLLLAISEIADILLLMWLCFQTEAPP